MKRLIKKANENYNIKEIIGKLFKNAKGKEDFELEDSEICIGTERSTDYYEPPEGIFVESTLCTLDFDVTTNLDDVLNEEEKKYKNEIIEKINEFFNENIDRLSYLDTDMKGDLEDIFIETYLDYKIDISDDEFTEYGCGIEEMSVSEEGIFKMVGSCFCNEAE